MADDHYTKIADEGTQVQDGPDAVAEARRLHHLATADPEFDGKMTGPAHEVKYSLERADDSKALWEAAGVHPIENGALPEVAPAAAAEARAADKVPAKK